MQTTAHRTNRIPRITPTRPSLCRRLHRAVLGCYLRRRVDKLRTEALQLRAGILADHLQATQVQRTGASVPDGVMLRMREEAARYRTVDYALSRCELQLLELEGAA